MGKKSKIIGIDLGTTNSCVSVYEGSDAKVIVNEEGGRTTPSVIAYTKDKGIYVGQVAKRQAVSNPKNTIYSIKRFMGRKYEEVSEESNFVPYELTKGKNGGAYVNIEDKVLAPPEISAHVLKKLKKSAEEYLGEDVDSAVITVPAYFNDAQRQATKAAGEIAGLDVKRIINEPTAAALAYGLNAKKDEKIAVYDFGGGTFDISILEVGDGIVEVKSTNGDTHLGGDNIDDKITEWLMEQFKNDEGVDLTDDVMAMQRLKEASEKAKIELSTTLEAMISLPFLSMSADGPKNMDYTLSKSKYEQLIEKIVERSKDPCYKALEDAGMEAGDIDQVILVGGTTRIPKVQEAVKAIFGKEPNKTVNPDEVVALGAAIQGGILNGYIKDTLLLDVAPLSLGIETMGGEYSALIERNTTIPTTAHEEFSTAKDNQPSVDVHVLQGERPMAKDNKSLGRFHLDKIPPAPRGVPRIDVTFDIDADGIMKVSAKDKGTGKEKNITIKGSSTLDESEIERMVADAEKYAEEDLFRKDLIKARNSIEDLIYNTDKVLVDFKDDISDDNMDLMKKYMNDAKKSMTGEDLDVMKTTFDQVNKGLLDLNLYPQETFEDEEEVDDGEVIEPEVSDGPDQPSFWM